MTRPDVDVPRFIYITVGIASLGGLLFGYDFAVIAGAILFIKGQFALSPTMEEVIISAAIYRSDGRRCRG